MAWNENKKHLRREDYGGIKSETEEPQENT